MSPALVISLAGAAGVLLVAGVLFGTYSAGWLPGLAPGSEFATAAGNGSISDPDPGAS
jgi:hypothetical protein